MAWYNWSRTPASNATADTSINMAEGMAPSQVNDGIRALMARTAEYRDDTSGAIATGGTSTAYTVTSYQVFDTLAHMSGQMIAFTPHATNGATVTLNVDGLGAMPLRLSPNVELQSNVLIQGTPYVATYNNSDGAFYIHNLAGNTYGIPLGAGMDFWLPTAPSSAFVFPIGQAISRTTYAALYAAMGTTHGAGDGSTTFNLPDKRERVSVMKTSAASRLTSTYFGGDSTALGATGGIEGVSLTNAQLPFTTPTFTGTGATISVNATTPNLLKNDLTMSLQSGGTYPGVFGSTSNTSLVSTGSYTPAGSVSAFGGNAAHNNVQPTIVCNYILRVI